MRMRQVLATTSLIGFLVAGCGPSAGTTEYFYANPEKLSEARVQCEKQLETREICENAGLAYRRLMNDSDEFRATEEKRLAAEQEARIKASAERRRAVNEAMAKAARDSVKELIEKRNKDTAQ